MKYNLKKKIDKIDSIIISICEDISEIEKNHKNWKKLKEIHLLEEVVLCILSSQIIFELATATTKTLFKKGILDQIIDSSSLLKESLRKELSQPINFYLRGQLRQSKIRFLNRSIDLLSNNSRTIYSNGLSIRYYLENAYSPLNARRSLIENIAGIGAKQASLFLRRIGYCSDLAILDVHIIDYLRLKGLIQTNKINTLKNYEAVEKIFKKNSKKFGFSIGIVDYATWITMRVVKKEAFI